MTYSTCFGVGRVVTHSFVLSFLAYNATFGQFQNLNLKCKLYSI